jgi:hypothetical protein
MKDNSMKPEMIQIKRTFTDFFGEVKKVDYIGPYFAEEGEWIRDVQMKHDMSKGKNVNGFPATSWEIVPFVR